jgi:hypothetical protein
MATRVNQNIDFIFGLFWPTLNMWVTGPLRPGWVNEPKLHSGVIWVTGPPRPGCACVLGLFKPGEGVFERACVMRPVKPGWVGGFARFLQASV